MRKDAGDLNRDRLTEIQEWARIGYWEIDLKNGDFTCSAGACTIFGIDHGNGKYSLDDFLALVHPDDRDRVSRKHSVQINNPEPFEITYRILHPDGSQRYLREKNNLTYDREGRPLLCRFLIQDAGIRTHVQSPIDFAQAQVFWKPLIDAIGDYILIMDTNRQILSINSSTQKLLGRSQNEIIGKPCHEILYGASFDCPCTICPLREAADLKESQTREITNDYLQKILLVTTTPYLDAKGELLGYINFCKDITEWKKLESQVCQNEKMEAISTLAGGIAHDFNNILGAIYGFTELALLDSQPDTNLRNNLDQVKNAADRAKDLVGQLLTFSRKSETQQQPIQLFPIVKETTKIVEGSLPSTIEIQRNIETGPEKVMADPAQILQLIMNLCTNASQAMDDEGGRIEISLQAVILGREDCHNISDLSPGRHILLTVSDSGKGMDKEVLDRIFAPYFTTREKGQGTGMGLTVAHGIVTGSNGAIYVESEPGKGTIFRIYFPVVEEGASEPHKPAIINLPTGKERILYVDDETEIVSMARNLLEYLGYEVTTFTDSEEALKAFNQAPEDYDLLITDQVMPGLTGDELSRRVLEIRPDLPILLCTGYREKVSETEMKNIGLKSILYKPLALQQLGNTVRNAIDGR